jgi:hypothetical protein
MTLDDLIHNLESERERLGGDVPVFAGQENGGTHTRVVVRVDLGDDSGTTIRFSAE